MKRAIIIISVLLMASCSTEKLAIDSPHAITDAKLAQISDGNSKKDILKIFGKPTDRVVHPEGESWFYKDINLKSLSVEFDRSGIVTSHESSEGTGLSLF